jgi:hypothetical protein
MKGSNPEVPLDFLQHIVDLRRQGFRDRQTQAIDGLSDEDRNDPKEVHNLKRKIASRELYHAVIEIFVRSFEAYPDHWVPFKALQALFPKITEKGLRASIQKAKRDLLKSRKMALANKPAVGYRLGVVSDIPLETLKSILRSISNMVSAIKTIEMTKPTHWLLDGAEMSLVNDCRETIRTLLPSLRSFEGRVSHLPVYQDLSDQIEVIEKTLKFYEDKSSL